MLGEAVAQLSEATRASYPDIAWSDPVRMRNPIGHGYWSVDLDVLTDRAHDDLPNLLDQMEDMLDGFDA